MAASENCTAAGRIAFTYPSFVLFELARFFIVLSGEMQSVAVGWEVYEITKRPLALGLVGLAIPAWHFAFPRNRPCRGSFRPAQADCAVLLRLRGLLGRFAV